MHLRSGAFQVCDVKSITVLGGWTLISWHWPLNFRGPDPVEPANIEQNRFLWRAIDNLMHTPCIFKQSGDPQGRRRAFSKNLKICLGLEYAENLSSLEQNITTLTSVENLSWFQNLSVFKIPFRVIQGPALYYISYITSVTGWKSAVLGNTYNCSIINDPKQTKLPPLTWLGRHQTAPLWLKHLKRSTFFVPEHFWWSTKNCSPENFIRCPGQQRSLRVRKALGTTLQTDCR